MQMRGVKGTGLRLKTEKMRGMKGTELRVKKNADERGERDRVEAENREDERGDGDRVEGEENADERGEGDRGVGPTQNVDGNVDNTAAGGGSQTGYRVPVMQEEIFSLSHDPSSQDGAGGSQPEKERVGYQGRRNAALLGMGNATPSPPVPNQNANQQPASKDQASVADSGESTTARGQQLPRF
ncbi:hypothetical protein Salat_0239200 [Sesamum alatum]|uniref:Uncharacterized protein n=1 Tax=Sesamum alatum TaxID=300844 RepID=A0AAE1YYL9_9LAMI|nr:hypothetical protein Salat_0239200 [Sesamum alatum]